MVRACAVHAWKHGQGIEGCSRTGLAGKIGGILSRMGASIDLDHPERSFDYYLTNGLAQNGHVWMVIESWSKR